MNIEAMLALLEEQLDSYTIDDTLERLHSYESVGPALEEFHLAGIEIFSYADEFSQQAIEYSLIEGRCCNDENYFDMKDTSFELAA